MGLTLNSTGQGIKEDLLILKRNEDDKIIAVAGNPNVGKSTLFNALTGMKQHTGNWPGKTVSNAKGYLKTKAREYVLVDIPGTYSLFSHSKEEEIARDFICSSTPDAVVVVCDATCLERSLRLVFQILEITRNVIVCVNLLDEAAKKGISVNLKALQNILGVTVVGTVARSKKSLKSLTNALDNMTYNKDESCENSLNKSGINLEKCDILKETYYVTAAENAAKACVAKSFKAYADFDRKADKVLTSKTYGYPIMLLLLLFIFWLTIFGANYLSEGLSFILEKMEAGLNFVLTQIKTPMILHSFIVNGVYKVPAAVVSVMLPPMAIFFPLFTFLEDIGFLPRIAYNLDSPFKKCKSCGKQALTMCMGFGCNAAGVVGCRIIDSPRERLLAVITNSLVPCNGRFPTIIAIISMFFVNNKTVYTTALSAFYLSFVIVVTIVATLSLTKLLSSTILRGEPSSYILELPPFRKPKILSILVRSCLDRTLFVLGRSLTAAVPVGIIIWLLVNFRVGDNNLLYYFTDILNPIALVIGLDGIILAGFILGLPANEIVMPIILMAYLSGNVLVDMGSLAEMKTILVNNGWDIFTAIGMLIFTLFHWPCATTLLTIKKETGSVKWTVISALLPTALGVLLCGLLNLLKIAFA